MNNKLSPKHPYTLKFNDEASVYNYALYLVTNAIHFSVGTVDKDIINVLQTPSSCRETLILRFNQHSMIKDKVSFTNVRILLHTLVPPSKLDKVKSKTEKAIDDGITLINTFSKQHGWPTASFEEMASPFKTSQHMEIYSYVLNVPTHWLKAPQLMSLLLLLLRVGSCGYFTDLTNYDSFFTDAVKIPKRQGKKIAAFFNDEDYTFLRSYSKLLKIFFDNYKHLFYRVRAINLWKKDNYVKKGTPFTASPLKYEGVRTLLYGRSWNYALATKMKGLAEKANIKLDTNMYL